MTDHELRRAFAELAELRSDTEPVVTLYLDTHWSDEKQRERARVYVQDAVKRAIDHHIAHPQLDALRRTLGRVAKAAAERIEQEEVEVDRGLAVFACETLGLWRVLMSPRPFKSELCLDGRPHLLQLARLADDIEPAIVALVQADGAQLFEVALGAVVNEARSVAACAVARGSRGAARPRAAPTSSASRRTIATSRSTWSGCGARRSRSWSSSGTATRAPTSCWSARPGRSRRSSGTSRSASASACWRGCRGRRARSCRAARCGATSCARWWRGSSSTSARRRRERWSTPSARRCAAVSRCSGRRTSCSP